MLLLFKDPNVHLNRKCVYYCIFFICVSLLSLKAALSTLFVLCIRSYIAIIIVSSLSFEEFSNYYSKIMLFLGSVSLFSIPLFILGVKSPLPLFSSIDSRGIQNFIFFGINDLMNDKGFRNIGLWWEPGAFAVFINLAFLFSIINREVSLKKFFIYLILILSISSTTGIIVFLLLSLLLINLKRKTLLMKLSLLIGGGGTLGAFISFAADQLLDKFDSTSVKFVSFLSRYYDVVISYGLFMKNPFLGYGLGTPVEQVQVLASDIVGTGIYFTPAKPTGADGITFLIAQVGFMGILLILPFVFPKYANKLNLMQRCIVALALFISFNTENFSYSLIFTVLALYGVSYMPKLKVQIQ